MIVFSSLTSHPEWSRGEAEHHHCGSWVDQFFGFVLELRGGRFERSLEVTMSFLEGGKWYNSSIGCFSGRDKKKKR